MPNIDAKSISGLSHGNLPSERSFGLLFVFVFCLLGIYARYMNWHQYAAPFFFLIGVALIPISFFLPGTLRPFNKAWFWLGQTLGKIVSPVVLGAIFFLILTPVALIGKVFGRDELRLRRRNIDSYWIQRIPPGPKPESFKNQF